MTDEVRSAQVSSQRLPVHLVPAALKVLGRSVGVTGMVKRQLRLVTLLLEGDPHDRIDTAGPGAHTPGLHQALVRDELDVAPRYLAAEQRDGLSLDGRDFRRSARDLAERLAARECGIDLFRGCLEPDFLVNGHGFVSVCCRAMDTIVRSRATVDSSEQIPCLVNPVNSECTSWVPVPWASCSRRYFSPWKNSPSASTRSGANIRVRAWSGSRPISWRIRSRATARITSTKRASRRFSIRGNWTRDLRFATPFLRT